MLILCLHTVRWFQVLLYNISNSIHQVILSNTKNLNTAVWFHKTDNDDRTVLFDPYIELLQVLPY